MENVKAIEKVQILDNGELLASVEVKPDKTWSYSPSGLSVGVHRFQAVYGQLPPSTWDVTVRTRQPVDVDDLEDALLGPFTTLTRAFYFGSVKTSGYPGRIQVAKIYDFNFDSIRGRSMTLSSKVSPTEEIDFDSELTLAFRDGYSEISFQGGVEKGWETHNSFARMSVYETDPKDNPEPLGSWELSPTLSSWYGSWSIKSRKPGAIKFLKMEAVSAGRRSWGEIRLNTISMIR